MVTIDFSTISLKIKNEDDKTVIFDPVRKRWVALTPEEHVRQLIIGYLINMMKYPPALMAVEKKVSVGTLNKRFDIAIYDRKHLPWMLVECKAPEVEVTERTLHQLLSYQGTMQCNYWVLTNGRNTWCADACNAQQIDWLDALPAYNL